MASHRRVSDFCQIYLCELMSRVVAKSGRPSDRHHLGKLILQSFRDSPEFTLQIDGATNESETFGSALDRSTRCATALRTIGIGHGDVIVLMAPNHVHLSVPFYAALYLGVAVSAIDRDLKVTELQHSLSVSQPKAIFCQSNKVADVQEALSEINLDARIVTFDDHGATMSLKELMDTHGIGAYSAQFKAEDFETEKTVACLIATSGTTGLPKYTTTTHKNIAVNLPYALNWYDEFPTPTRLVMIPSPLQWLTALSSFIRLPILRITRLQSSHAMTTTHFNRLVKTYKPTWLITSPTFITQAMNCMDEEFDLRSFEMVFVGGSVVPKKLLDELKQLSPHTEFYNGFGISEATGLVFLTSDPSKASACGRPIGVTKHRLVCPETGKTIHGPNVSGELWLKGPGIFKGYYNNAEATVEAFTEDGWFKTGDIFFREKDDTFHFVERLKLLLKYNSYQISPMEIEDVIRRHPYVQDISVVGIPDATCGELPVACVVRKTGSHVTAQEIKDIVKHNLADWKQLRGGVIFIDQLPMTVSTKIDRRALKVLAMSEKRE